jgi:hypothetical protein
VALIPRRTSAASRSPHPQRPTDKRKERIMRTSTHFNFFRNLRVRHHVDGCFLPSLRWRWLAGSASITPLVRPLTCAGASIATTRLPPAHIV